MNGFILRPSLKNCLFVVTLPTHFKPLYSNFFMTIPVKYFFTNVTWYNILTFNEKEA